MRATLLLCTALALGSAGARAGAQDHAAIAHERFRSGLALYNAGRFADALPELRTSLDLYASPNTRLLVARCLREVGRLAEAVVEFERTVGEASDRLRSDPRYEETRASAQREAAALQDRVARLRVNLVQAPPEGLRVRVGAREWPRGALGVALPIDPGRVTVTAEAPGRARTEQTVELTAGRTESVTLTLALALPPPDTSLRRAPAVSAPRPAPASRRGPAGATVAGGAVLGLGIASGITAAVLYGLAAARHDALARDCGAGPCADRTDPRIAEGEAFNLGAHVALGVGLAGVVSGAVLLGVGLAQGAPSQRVRATHRGIMVEF